jgi:hypothetical protein
MMAMLATFAHVRVLILWSYWLFSKVAKVANIPTGVKVAIFEFKHGHHARLVWRGKHLVGKKPFPRDFPSLCRNFG